MGILKDFLTGKTSRKIKKTKRQVADVRSLLKLKRGGHLAKPVERQGAARAAGRLGDSMAAFPIRSQRKRKK